MTNTEYILTDEMETIVAAAKTTLGLSVLNYQYGYVEELIETLHQMEASPAHYSSKYPLVWLAEPYSVKRGDDRSYGTAIVDLFIIRNTEKQWKAKERMTNNFKPHIIPIYRTILQQIVQSSSFDHPFEKVPEHTTVNRYYFGENGKSVLNDVVDAMKISGLKLRISEKQDCKPLSNFN